MQGGNYFNKNYIEKVRRNINRYDWAKQLADQTVQKAEHMLEFSQSYWWTLPTPQEIPRSSIPCQKNLGCPVCGEEVLLKYGSAGWIHLVKDQPWKTQCPNCKSIFPSNDFKSYYESGLDDRGIFHKDKADPAFLVNTLYKDKGKDYFVDDGTGYLDENGVLWSFVAQYNHYGVWVDIHNIGGTKGGLIINGLKHLSEAYVYTGEEKYALYALMILYKVAMIYPPMDLNVYMRLPGRPYRNSDGFSLQGKVVGCIWETFVARLLCYAADATLPFLRENPEKVTEFISKMFPADADTVMETIINGIVRQVYIGIKNARIAGNEGMHQAALAMAAVCMGECDESREWLDFLFKPGKRILEKDPVRSLDTFFTGCNVFGVLENKVNGNGLGDECSPMYNRLWMAEFARLADILSAYPGISGTKYDLKTHPVMKRMYKSYVPLNLDNDFIPKTGDTGKTGNPMKIFDGDNLQKLLWQGYEATKDQGILDLFNISYPKARDGIFGYIDVEDPEKAAQLLRSAKNPDCLIHERSHNLTDYGDALLRQRKRHGCNVHMYYGRTKGHGHLDKMNFEIIAHGLNFSPDLGYPEYAENVPSRFQWTSNTVSHNTVMVDRAGQSNTDYAGIPYGYEDGSFIKYIDADDPRVYEQVTMYRRAMCMVDVTPNQAYIVDLFRVAGGQSHELSFHGAEGDVTVKGVKLSAQPKGTLEGEDVPYGEWKEQGQRRGNGYSFLYDVEKSEESVDYIELEYKLKDTWGTRKGQEGQPYLKVYMPGDKCKTVIAKGKPPTNKIGNPPYLYYYLGERKGTDLKSRFVSVYEPFIDQGVIRSVETVKVDGDKNAFSVVCVKVTLNDGSMDYIIHSLDTGSLFSVEDQIAFQGGLGYLKVQEGRVIRAFMSNASLMAYKGETVLECENPCYTGSVADYQRNISEDHWIDIVMDQKNLPVENLIGRFINIDHNNVGNGSYEILSAEKTGNGLVRILASESAVRGYKEACDPESGYVYRFSEGARFTIPMSCEMKND